MPETSLATLYKNQESRTAEQPIVKERLVECLGNAPFSAATVPVPGVALVVVVAADAGPTWAAVAGLG